MKLFYENITEGEKIPIDFPLDAGIEQTLEIFDSIPENDGSSFGVVNDHGLVIQFHKYNKFMWLVEIPDLSKHGAYQAICNPNQCVRLLKEVFDGADPFGVFDFKFESFL